MQITLGRSFELPLVRLLGNAIAVAMIWLPPGVFLMGPDSGEPDLASEVGQQFEARISQGFWLGKHPVTQAQWLAVMRSNPSTFQQIKPDCPVENVSWYDAMEFCQRLNEQISPNLPRGYSFSLPTEAQWEYACRAGTSTVYNVGDTLADLDRAAWHKANSSGHTHPVGEKEPNGWGFFDMHGNTFEWCFDPTSAYPQSAATDWVGTGDGLVRSIRSGSWRTEPVPTEHGCSCRGYVMPDEKRSWFGFRLCLRPSSTRNLQAQEY